MTIGRRSPGKCGPKGWKSRRNNAARGQVTRWHHHLNPDLTHEKWSNDQNLKLFDLHKKYGPRWKDIASHYDGRTDNGIKNQFFSIIRKSLRKACKHAGLAIPPTTINSIKPKILSQFLKDEASGPGDGEPRQMKSLRITDLIYKFAFSRTIEADSEKKRLFRDVLENGFERLEALKLTQQHRLHHRKTVQKIV